jgi:uncharacterized membrane protein
MNHPVVPYRFGIFLFVIAFLFAIVQLGLLSIAFDKLELSANAAFTLLLVSLAGSLINVPIVRVSAEAPAADQQKLNPFGLFRQPRQEFKGFTVIAVNLGGCVVPLGFSLYLLVAHALPVMEVVIAVVFVTVLSRLVSMPVPGIGIGMPVFIAPLAAAIAGITLGNSDSAPIAYIAGTMGVLLGADLLRINDIRRLGIPIASIGGAGTFDGIFISGIVAVLLA